MSMTVVVTRNLPERFHGFLASCMLVVAPGVFVAPTMRKAIRERVWQVMNEWASLVPADGGIAMFWKSQDAPSGLGLRMIGWPKKELLEHEGIWLTMSPLTQAHNLDELQRLNERADAPD